MSKIFVIPDVHLKPWMFEKASEILSENQYDAVVLLGDLVDDWGKGQNIALYEKTFDAVINFVKDHPETYWCYGNHDVSYLWYAMETGFSFLARDTVVEGIEKLKKVLKPGHVGYIHRFDKTLFCHGGLTESFMVQHFGYGDQNIDSVISKINSMGKEDLWKDNSPLWARPQEGAMRLYSPDYLQVVGHTPMMTAVQECSLLSLDNFSTYTDGNPYGDQRFVFVDTVEKTWQFA